MSVRRLMLAVAVACAAMWTSAAAYADPDLDHNGRVDANDLRLLMDGWKRFKHGQDQWQSADVNGDGTIDYRDACELIDAFLLGSAPTVQLVDYWVASPGDLRLWQDAEGLIWEQEQTAAAQATGAVELHVTDMFGRPASPDPTVWGVENGKVRAFMGWYVGSTFFQAAPVGQGVAIPETLTVGAPVQQDFDVFVGGTRAGHGTFTIAARGINETVQTPAGTFKDCMRLEIRVQWSNDAGDQQGSFAVLAWMAPGVGPVKRDDPDNPGQNLLVLAYARVGADEYGQRPTADVSQVFPCASNDLYLWRIGTETYGLDATLHTDTLGIFGFDSLVLSDLELPLESNATHWVVRNNFVRGFWAWTDKGDRFELNPPFEWPANMLLGDITAQNGNVIHENDTAYGTYSAACAVVGVNKTVDVPAGRFDGCIVLALSVHAQRQGDELFALDIRLWIKPGVGPVLIEDFEVSPGQSGPSYHMTSLPMIFVRSGNNTFGTQPTVDYADLLKLSAGNCWRLQTPGGDWQIRSVAGTVDISGSPAWRVVTARAPAGGPLDELSSLLYETSDSYVGLVGYEPDPDEMQLVAPMIFQPPIAIPRPMRMGEMYWLASAVFRADTGEKLGELSWTAMYVGNRDVHGPTGNFAGAPCIQWYFEFTQGNQTDITRSTELYDNAAGLVALDEEDLSGNPPSADHLQTVWAHLQSGTRGSYPGSFDLASFWPLQTGDVWRYGQSNVFTQYEVRAKTNVATWQGALPLAYWDSSSPAEVDIDYWVSQAAKRLLVAFQPSDYPRTVLYQNPVQWPKPWALGVAAAADTAIYDPFQPNTKIPVRYVAIPVDAGIDVHTPAGDFKGCVRLVRLTTFDLSPLGEQPEWSKSDMLLAPGVGPVSIQARHKGEETYSGPGKLFYAVVGGKQYGSP